MLSPLPFFELNIPTFLRMLEFRKEKKEGSKEARIGGKKHFLKNCDKI